MTKYEAESIFKRLCDAFDKPLKERMFERLWEMMPQELAVSEFQYVVDSLIRERDTFPSIATILRLLPRKEKKKGSVYICRVAECRLGYVSVEKDGCWFAYRCPECDVADNPKVPIWDGPVTYRSEDEIDAELKEWAAYGIFAQIAPRRRAA